MPSQLNINRPAEFLIKTMLSYLDKNPDEDIPKLLEWWERCDKDDVFKPQKDVFRSVIENPDNNWYRLMKSFWEDIDAGVRKRFFENLFVKTSLVESSRRAANQEKYNCNIPWAILMDPTSACNLSCTGCWAAEYGSKLNMSYETLDDIIRQGTELGTYIYVFSGGEPLVRKHDIIRLCEAHPDCEFLAFTNGTLIDEAFADEMLRVKNFIPAISLEGFEEQTDYRRGAGTYQAVLKAMEILRKKKLIFGLSCCYTSKNTETIGSEEYIDFMVNQGAKFAWFFTYMPVGVGAVPELLVTAEQRAFMYRQIREFRKTKPIFTLDFWNDGEYVEGCIAGGRRYIHINANGDIEPCAFTHYSDSNIHNKTLLEAYRSPLFAAYYNNQPFNDNYLRPCPLLDNVGALAAMVEKSGAKSTDLQNPENVYALTEKCRLTAEKWEPVANELWSYSPRCPSCSGLGHVG